MLILLSLPVVKCCLGIEFDQDQPTLRLPDLLIYNYCQYKMLQFYFYFLIFYLFFFFYK